MSCRSFARLRVRTERAGVIVADHDDQTGPKDSEQCAQLVSKGSAWSRIVLKNGAKRAKDVTDMRFVEGGASMHLFRCG